MEAGVFREERSGAVLTAALAGLGAAVVGGVAWGLIVKWSGYEIGFAAWGVGFVVGTAVAFGGQGLRGKRLQVLAVVLALGGILLGKYLAFVWIGRDVLGSIGVSLPLFSSSTARLFWDIRSDVWSAWDLLWAGLAVVTAFRIPRSKQAEPFFDVAPHDSGLIAPASPATVVNPVTPPSDRTGER
jgi:hypothetical protein